MATLTILIWMVVIVLFFHGLINYESEVIENDEIFVSMPKTLMGSWVIIHFITIAPISIGLYWDIFESFPETAITLSQESINFWLLCSLVALGITTVSSIWMNNIRSRKLREVRPTPEKTIVISTRVIVDLIGLIASILGIVGFYLDHIQ